jgi:hypothetical protein
MARRQWSDLSERSRRTIMVLGVVEGVLKAAALVDLRRRADDEIRGPKKAWALAIAFVNAAGAVPVTYFLLGRRKQGSAWGRSIFSATSTGRSGRGGVASGSNSSLLE